MEKYLKGYADATNWVKAHATTAQSRFLCLEGLKSFRNMPAADDRERGLADGLLDAFGC